MILISRELLTAAAWLLSSEAVETIREAPHWLFGLLVSHPYVHRSNGDETEEFDRSCWTGRWVLANDGS